MGLLPVHGSSQAMQYMQFMWGHDNPSQAVIAASRNLLLISIIHSLGQATIINHTGVQKMRLHAVLQRDSTHVLHG